MLTKIEWVDHSVNPVRVKGGKVWPHGYHCTKVSPGCAHCYAEGLNIMRGTGLPFDDRKVEFYLDLSVFDKLPKNRGVTVFVQSMGDIFHEQIPFEFIDEMFLPMLASYGRNRFLFLTKRPGRMAEYFNSKSESLQRNRKFWFGITAENQATLDERWNYLKQIQASVVFISHEPALGSLILPPDFLERGKRAWLIAGGESGPKARPAHPDWIIQDRDQCQGAGVPFFFKQWGEWSPNQPENFCRLTKNKWSHQTFAWGKDGNEYRSLNPDPDDFPLMTYKVGKKEAGRLLDSREWNEYPE